ncbi:hypothetical protein JB92DRAFT_2897254 [Gautieria morchelliformis]|nr:hypothetical protein JB92DRAFT_2897254 [Gautieria morchelliformis]
MAEPNIRSLPSLSTLKDLQANNFNMVSATALLVYEIIITQGQELEFLWRSPRSLCKVPYFFVRYFPLVFMILEDLANIKISLPLNVSPKCEYLFRLQIWGTTFLVIAVDALVIMRLFVLYGQTIRVGVFLITMWIIVFAVKPMGISLSNGLLGIVPSCLSLSPPEYNYALSCWSVLRFKSVIFLSFMISSAGGSIHYSKVMCRANLLNFMLEKFGPPQLENIGGCWMPSYSQCQECCEAVETISPTRPWDGMKCSTDVLYSTANDIGHLINTHFCLVSTSFSDLATDSNERLHDTCYVFNATFVKGETVSLNARKRYSQPDNNAKG